MFYSLPTAANRKHAEERQYLRNFVAGIVQKRKDQLANHPEEAPTDLLTNLIRNSSEEDKLSEESLSDTLMVLLLAGYETTSVTMTYVLYMLSQHPRVKKECLEEIDAGVEELVYLRAVITETLRLYPPVISTTRSSEREISLDGIHIPKGTYLYFPIWWIQRDERNFERPLEFIPERWTRKSSGQASLFSSTKWVERKFGDGAAIECGVQAGNPGAFVAFSAGARSCAGQRFAMQEMTTALSILLKHFEFEPPEDYELVPYRSGVVQTPKGGLPMKIVKRDHK